MALVDPEPATARQYPASISTFFPRSRRYTGFISGSWSTIASTWRTTLSVAASDDSGAVRIVIASCPWSAVGKKVKPNGR